MKIISKTVPAKMPALLRTIPIIHAYGDATTREIFERLVKMPGSPSSSNATFKEVGFELMKMHDSLVYFDFYWSKNPFVGHNVISHATISKAGAKTVNYNTRFHSVKTFAPIDWFRNYFHELTHLADQSSPFSFSHNGQHDENSAPEVIGRFARDIFLEKGLK